jgi:hypothetical protein
MTTRWWKVAMIVLALAGPFAFAQAAPPTFRITQVFVSPNGYSQFVELTEWAGQDGQNGFRGLTLTMTGTQGVRTMTFADDLPTTRTAHMSVIVEWYSDAFDSGYFYGSGGIAYYDGLGAGFIDPNGGTLDFAGVDTFPLPPVPLDGVNAVYRDRLVAPSTLPLQCDVAPCPRVPHEEITTSIIEYHNYALGRFFWTSDAREIAALELGIFPGWKQSGGYLMSYITPRDGYTTPVCRFYAPPELGNSHILTASADECATLAQPGSGFILESRVAFYVALPDPVTGVCAQGIPIYRYWNRAGGADHRYTQYKLDLRLSYFSALLSEGYGPDGVGFCTLAFTDEGF